MSWTYREQTNASFVTELVHLPFLFSVEQVVVVLHANELRPPVPLGAVLHLCELIGPHRTRPDVSHLAASDEIVQGLHCFLDRRFLVEAVYLQQVDIVGLEALERSVHGVEDRCSRKPCARANRQHRLPHPKPNSHELTNLSD